MDETLTGTTTSSQSGPGSNVNEGILYIPQSSGTEASTSDAVQYPTQDTCSRVFYLWAEKIFLKGFLLTSQKQDSMIIHQILVSGKI